MVSPSQELTAQFYDWEQRGRGWFLAECLVELEPAFEPFWEHYLANDIIDDGVRTHWLTNLFSRNAPKAIQPSIKQQPVVGYEATGSGALTIYRITLPKHDKTSPGSMEELLRMLSYRSCPVSIELIGSAESIDLQWVCRDIDAAFVYTQLTAFFPEVHVAETHIDRAFEVVRDAQALYTVDFGLEEEFMRPLALHGQSQEPLTGLFGVLELLKNDLCAIVQIMCASTLNPWPESIMTAVCDESKRQSFFLDDPDMPRLATEKISRPLYGVVIRAIACANTLDTASSILQQLIPALVHASSSPYNRLMPLPVRSNDPEYSRQEWVNDFLLRQTRRVGMLVNSSELATLVHFPSAALRTKKVVQNIHATKAAPSALIGHSYKIGENSHQGHVQIVGLPPEQRLRHIHIMGATGTGKSTLLHSLIMQDIDQGGGCMVLDPHGDLIDTILSAIPEKRIKDVVFIDPSDSAFPVACNILAASSELEKELLASDLVNLFKRFSTSWGDQMHSVLANALLALLYNTGTFHLGDLRKFLIEPSIRASILATVTDPDIVYYWHKEFPLLKGGSVGPLITRLDSFLRPKVIRTMVCQKTGLDMATLMDSKKIVLVKLAQGLVGAENSYLLGAFIVSKLQQTAMARQSQSADNRIPFYCYIDEFQNFITPSMATILSGARKYRLGLILAHQDMQQVSKYDTEIASSILANAGVRICFRLGDTDAKRLQDGFAAFTGEDLQNLGIGETIVRVNTADADFNVAVVPYSNTITQDNTQAIIAHSRNVYSVAIPQTEPPQAKSPEQPIPPSIPVQKEPVPVEPITVSIESENKAAVREHRSLQASIKKLAQAHGYRASIEVPTPDGNGFVDVLLERDGETIAVEISITTTADWELHNVQKCVAAGYTKIVVCTDQQTKRKQIQSRVMTELSPAEQQHIRVIASADIPTLFTQPHAPAPSETVLKGYRVKVNYESNANRQGLVQSILNATRKPQ